MFASMFWPLIGGFIAFVLLAVMMGRIMDPTRHRDDFPFDIDRR